MSGTESHECPVCKQGCSRDSADVGVGVIYGPWGCPCGWSEDPRYNLLSGSKYTELGGRIDQYGGITPRDEPNCLLCLDKKTVPSNLVDGYVMDCPDCCGEEG